MMTELTANQAAQKLLTLVDTLKTERQHNSTLPSHKLDASSISWAFHDSADTTGFLRWLVENVDASSNGLTADELELLEYLERIDYKEKASGGEKKTSEVEREQTPGFELEIQKSKLHKKIANLETHIDVLRGQSRLLTSRVDQMTRELAELKAEEEVLAKAAGASDAEVARLTSAYSGLLDEARLAASKLLDAFDAEQTKDSSKYFYQCGSEIDRLCSDLNSFASALSQSVAKQMQLADALPHPWREFRPFGTQAVSEILDLAASEHKRIGYTMPGLTKKMIELQVMDAFIDTLEVEVDRALKANGVDGLLQRCQSLAVKEGRNMRKGGDIGQLLDEYAAKAIPTTLADSKSLLQRDIDQKLVQLNQWHNDLAKSQKTQIRTMLEAIRNKVLPFDNATEAILESLLDEHDMVSSWAEIWGSVAERLEKDNSRLDKQKAALQEIAHKGSNDQVIHSDDILALSLKRLLTVSNHVLNKTTAISDFMKNAGQDGSDSVQTLQRMLLAVSANTESGAEADSDGDADMQDQQLTWLGHGAFTSWDALLADAKTQKNLASTAKSIFQTTTKTMAGIERQM